MPSQYLQGSFGPAELCAGAGLLQVSALTGWMLLQLHLAHSWSFTVLELMLSPGEGWDYSGKGTEF